MDDAKTYLETEEYGEHKVRLDRQTQRAARASEKIADLKKRIEAHRKSQKPRPAAL